MFFGKEVRVQLTGQGKEAYLELKKRDDKEALALLRSINRIIEILKQNPQFGDPIKKQLKFPVNNPNFLLFARISSGFDFFP